MARYGFYVSDSNTGPGEISCGSIRRLAAFRCHRGEPARTRAASLETPRLAELVDELTKEQPRVRQALAPVGHPAPPRRAQGFRHPR
jgi:hypothetical protein